MIEIEFTTRITLERDGNSPDDYRKFFVTSHGRIVETGGDDNDKETKVGTLTAVLVDADRAIEAGLNLWEAADACEGAIENLATVFYHRDGQMKVDVLPDANPFISQPNLLYISNIEVEPRFRGQGIGLAAIRRAIDLLSVSCELVVLKPLPPQFLGKVNGGNKQEAAAATRKLEHYYQGMGFKSVKGTRFMALNLTERRNEVLL